MEKFLELPLVAPLLALLKSRKFLVAVVTLVVDSIVAQVPELAGSKDVLIAASVAIASVLIGAIAHEDAAEKKGAVAASFGEDSTAG